ncbi:uncharacterized protein [Temnothorax longispinosus]|uniref:uncharacterized protein n=1 Tax=Temnothorax longispinosus TaxID=300112 RepID=UPI003A9930D4
MVWKCCVPGCATSSKLPSHALPKNVDRAHTWLRAIQRINLIDAPKEVLSKLRICFDHFSDDSIISYEIKRRLKDNAIPTLEGCQ